MKLLFDQNLSPRLCERLRDLWTGLSHVRSVGLAAADDQIVWEYAAKHDLTIVSKDGDFSNRAFLYGAPPEVVWIRVGNCSSSDIEAVFRERRDQLEAFAGSDDAALLIIDRRAL